MILDEALVLKRRKITEVFERKVVTRRERNEYGAWEMVERELIFRRPVPPVSGWARFVHFVMDYYLVPTGLLVLTSFMQLQASLIGAFLPLILFIGPFILLEFSCQKTIGKFLTGAIVVDEYGEKPDFMTIMKRSLIRLIPFEPFSYLGQDRGWHDRWTDTYVIHRKELEKIKDLLRIQEMQDEREPVF